MQSLRRIILIKRKPQSPLRERGSLPASPATASPGASSASASTVAPSDAVSPGASFTTAETTATGSAEPSPSSVAAGQPNTHKSCIDCGEDQPIESYSINRNYPDGRNKKCKKCISKARLSKRYPRPTEGTKFCTRCQVEHDVSEFHADSTSSDGLRSNCKATHRAQMCKSQSQLEVYARLIYKNICDRCRKKDFPEPSLTADDIVRMYRDNIQCALSGMPMTHKQSMRDKDAEQHILHPDNVSVDRIDSSRPYEHDNCQLVCAIVNRMKFDMPQDFFVDLCRDIVLHAMGIVNHERNRLIDQQMLENAERAKGLSAIHAYSNTLRGFLKKMYLSIIHNNKNRSKDLEITVTESDLANLYDRQQGYCALSGYRMTHSAVTGAEGTFRNPYNISIDRIDSSRGYTLENVHLVCKAVNQMKSDLPWGAALQWCGLIARFKNKI